MEEEHVAPNNPTLKTSGRISYLADECDKLTRRKLCLVHMTSEDMIVNSDYASCGCERKTSNIQLANVELAFLVCRLCLGPHERPTAWSQALLQTHRLSDHDRLVSVPPLLISARNDGD